MSRQRSRPFPAHRTLHFNAPDFIWPRVAALLFAPLLPLLVSCEQRPEMVPVHGKVLYDGRALEYGSVMFQPTGGGELARGQIQPDGTFSLTTREPGDGVQVGTSIVRVTAYEAQRGEDQARNRQLETPLGQSAIPAKYQNFGTSGLSVEITPDMPLPLVLNLE